MNNWEEKTVIEFASVLSGGTPSSSVSVFWNGDITWITPSDMSKLNSYKISKSQRMITSKGLNNSSAVLIPENSIVMSSRAPIGYFAVVDNEYSTNQGCKSIILKKNEVPLFHYYNFKFNVQKFINKGEGTTFIEISKKEIEQLKFKIPKPNHQQKIAKILNTIDAVIEKTEDAITKYQAIKKGMMHDLFTRGIDLKTGQLRPSFNDAPELYTESELGMIPKDWEDTFLGKYSIKNIYGPRFNANDYSKNGNVKTIRGTDFSKDGEILYSQCPIAKLPESKVNTHSLKEGDVVIVTTADCGLTAVFKKQDFEYIPSAYTVKYSFKDNVDPYFVKYFMNTSNAKKQVEQFIRKGTIANLPSSDLFRFGFPLPSPDEQKAIILRLSQIEKLINQERKNLTKHQSMKKGLMQDLLTGKVEVKV
ncbi:restriction endonuclease subunit S [Aquimarina algiphila]|uniref:restriction endonuclease subunit S n=1 Tax=Aquimarina algiphila TaxID=2047982 RepID=UPI00232B8624|nr:restriction endonuclease subunit S [Aquimarina algiphila]